MDLRYLRSARSEEIILNAYSLTHKAASLNFYFNYLLILTFLSSVKSALSLAHIALRFSPSTIFAGKFYYFIFKNLQLCLQLQQQK
jgi:hypothetical protein